ncbi:unnamed protein product [Linum trigynum]|uniref:Uncharacterized protein n=1 Tax=Linum trigynum TaxID=586398 RepID=A0AAV2G654_9ROSI
MVRQRAWSGRGCRQQAKAPTISRLIGGGLLEPAGEGSNDGGCWIWEVGLGRQMRAMEETARLWWLLDLGGLLGVGRGWGDGEAMVDGRRHWW